MTTGKSGLVKFNTLKGDYGYVWCGVKPDNTYISDITFYITNKIMGTGQNTFYIDSKVTGQDNIETINIALYNEEYTILKDLLHRVNCRDELYFNFVLNKQYNEVMKKTELFENLLYLNINGVDHLIMKELFDTNSSRFQIVIK